MKKHTLIRTMFLMAMYGCLALTTAGPVLAESSPAESTKPMFYPPPDRYDWIQLNSGEWLKGKLKVLYDDKLEFDSDELDLLKLDWSDIKKVRTAGILSIRFEDGTTTYGRLEIDGERVSVRHVDTVREFNRRDVVTIAAGEQRESNYWAAKISLGLNIRRGNSDLVEYNAMANAKRRTAFSQLQVDYLGNINQTQGVETANSHRLSGSFDVFKSRRFSWRMVFGEYFRDPFQNIENRVNLGTGFSYYIINSAKTEWAVTGGLGGQYIEYVSVQPGQKINNTSPALSGGTRYDTELTNWMDVEVAYNFQVIDRESGTFTHHAIASLSTEITRSLDLDVSFVWDYTQDPRPRSDGTIPEKSDYRLILGLGYDF